MRSARTDAADARTDSTTRTRIRDAAVRRFGLDGFRVGLRAIASDAGVSPALIVHHFGSKDGLRQACDEHVLGVIKEHKAAAVDPSGATAAFLSMAALDELAPLVGYALNTIAEGGDAGRSFFDHFVADAQEYVAQGVAAGTIKPSRDERARVFYLTLSGFGAILLDMRLHPPADARDLAAILQSYLGRAALPTVEIFSQGLYTDHRMLDAYLLHVGDPPSSPETPDEPTP